MARRCCPVREFVRDPPAIQNKVIANPGAIVLAGAALDCSNLEQLVRLSLHGAETGRRRMETYSTSQRVYEQIKPGLLCGCQRPQPRNNQIVI